MSVYKDVFSGDEMFSAASEREEVDEVAYCVRGEYSPVYTTHDDGAVTVRTAIDVVESYGLRVPPSPPPPRPCRLHRADCQRLGGQLVDITRTQFLEYLSTYTQKLRVYLRSSVRHLLPPPGPSRPRQPTSHTQKKVERLEAFEANIQVRQPPPSPPPRSQAPPT